jgi:hypothetical protein
MTRTANITSRRRLAVAAAAIGALALVPGSASARTTWFGSSLNHEPANAGSVCSDDDSAPQCTRVGSYYPGFSGRAKASSNGTVVRVKIYAQGPMTFRFQIVRTRHIAQNHQQGQAKLVINGPKLTALGPVDDSGEYRVETFKVKLPVHKGDSLAIATDTNTAEYCSDGTPGQLTFAPRLSGHGYRASTGYTGCLLLVQAVVKTR